MSEQFKIEVVNWLAGYGGPVEARETFAEISIFVNEFCVTDVEDRSARTTRKSIRTAAYPLACWIAGNWWRLLFEPAKRMDGGSAVLDWEMSHWIAASGGGYVWPNLSLWSDGFQVTARCVAKQMPDSLSPIRYLSSFEEIVSPQAMEAGLSAFVEAVLRRLYESGLRETALHELWRDLHTERTPSAVGATRPLEAWFGLDPEEGDEVLKEAAKWQKQVGQHAVEEIAAGTFPGNFRETLMKCKGAANSVKTLSRIEDYYALRAKIMDQGLAVMPSAAAGRDTARAVRKHWGLSDGVVTNAMLADRLSLGEYVMGSSASGAPLTLGVQGGSEDQLKLVLRDAHPLSKRFDVARLLGDHLSFEYGDAWKPATASFTARQKFQRAFASEFLCPFEMVRSRFTAEVHPLAGPGDFVEALATEYQVSQYVVQNYLFPEPAGYETRLGRG